MGWFEHFEERRFKVSGADLGVLGVPEPATWAMLIAGFGLVGGMVRRRRAVVSA